MVWPISESGLGTSPHILEWVTNQVNKQGQTASLRPNAVLGGTELFSDVGRPNRSSNEGRTVACGSEDRGSGRQSRCSVAEVNRHAYHPASGCDDGKHTARNSSSSNGAASVRNLYPRALRSLTMSAGTDSLKSTICVLGETLNKPIPAC